MAPDPQPALSDDLISAAAAAAPITASSRTDDVPPSWDERTVLTTMLVPGGVALLGVVAHMPR